MRADSPEDKHEASVSGVADKDGLMSDHYRQSFKEEAYDLLAGLESSLLALEECPNDEELISRVFRALHTIKGSGAMFGYEAVSSFTHEIETVFDLVRNGRMTVGRELVDVTLAAVDLIKSMLDTSGCASGMDRDATGELLASLKLLVPADATSKNEESPLSMELEGLGDLMGVLTEYEISRLKASIAKGRGIYTIEMVFSLSGIDEELREVADKIRKDGELLSKIPAMGEAPAGAIGFKLLFASSKDAGFLEQTLGIKPDRIAGLLLPDEGKTALPIEELHKKATYRIRFQPESCASLLDSDPVALLGELRGLGPCTIVAQTQGIPPLGEISHRMCYVFWDVILTTDQGIDAIKDVFILVEDDCRLTIEVIDDGEWLDTDGGYKKLGQILMERVDLLPGELSKVLMSRKPIGEILVESGAVERDQVHSALVEKEHIRETRQERQSHELASSIRVPADKLDLLINMVGELVTVQARLSQMTLSRSDMELMAVAEEVERLTAGLRDTALNMRMLPIGATFAKFKRLVRDLSSELGKEVEMTSDGEETELDKTVIEKLSDPLVHLIRNSIDHGIEPPDVREAAGKPRKGIVHLSAVHSGDSVLISITDDGEGMHKEAIRAKGIVKGLIPGNTELSESEIFALVFSPGFSTAAQVTSVSGRGVGMDVVKKAIDSLRGSILISSQRGEGTTIAIKIPLTLAIIESLLVRISNHYFVMPLSVVEECVELTHDDVERAHGRHLACVRNQIVPYLSLREEFSIAGEHPSIEQIVIAQIAGRRIGFVVDQVIGEHQTVIKSLGKVYKSVKGISGATILGDGTVALIIDVPSLVHEVEIAERESH